MTAKVVRWTIFGVVFALLPFILNALVLWSNDKEVKLSLLWPHGELLVVCAAIAADAVGDLIGSGNGRKTGKLIAGVRYRFVLGRLLVYASAIGKPPTQYRERLLGVDRNFLGNDCCRVKLQTAK
jgi:hypothetical protein